MRVNQISGVYIKNCSLLRSSVAFLVLFNGTKLGTEI